jgi:hypothetical protein
VADIAFGVIWYRVLATAQPVDNRLIDELVAILAGPQPDPTPSTTTRRKRT